MRGRVKVGSGWTRRRGYGEMWTRVGGATSRTRASASRGPPTAEEATGLRAPENKRSDHGQERSE
jgi:hypothetical protein